eukprot:381922-Rhodomonas_salina.6
MSGIDLREPTQCPVLKQMYCNVLPEPVEARMLVLNLCSKDEYWPDIIDSVTTNGGWKLLWEQLEVAQILLYCSLPSAGTAGPGTAVSGTAVSGVQVTCARCQVTLGVVGDARLPPPSRKHFVQSSMTYYGGGAIMAVVLTCMGCVAQAATAADDR